MNVTDFIQKIKLPFRKDKELYRCLYRILGFYPKNISYYKQALLHKSSSVKGANGRWQNNERLEFLGDAILDAVVGDVVYRHFENKREGFLTNARSKIVQRETLGKLAVEMGLDKLITSNLQRNAHKSYMAGNAFEALVGAIYLDYGYDRCMKFMEHRILSRLLNIDKVAYKEVNFKSKLLEWSQKNRIKVDYRDLPQTTDKSGQLVFHTIVIIEELEFGKGTGYSKKESQQIASKETLYMLKKDRKMEESVFEAKSRRTAMEEQPEALLPDIPEDAFAQPTKAERKQPKPAPEPVERKKKTTDEPAPEAVERKKKTTEEPAPEAVLEPTPEAIEQTEQPTEEPAVEQGETDDAPARKPRRRRAPRPKTDPEPPTE